MQRILMRSPHSPLVSVTPEQAILRDLINTNAGNLLFPYSISRALMRPGVTIDYVQNRPRGSRLRLVAQAISHRYDCFVIPLANAFRPSFAPELDLFSDLVEALDIPCIVVGVGLQAGVRADGSKAYRFDDSVRRFMRAVLEKSDCVGVRGDTTGAYLARLGFAPERDFTVIGCPSLYLYGPRLPRPRPLTIAGGIRMSLNSKVTLPKRIHKYMCEAARAMPDCHYIVQNTYELAALYYGLDLRTFHHKGMSLRLPDAYPTGRGHPAIEAGRVVGFVDVPSWLAFLQDKDLCFGTRIHGSIAGILAGAPTFTIVTDARVRELVEYHNIPHVKAKRLKASRDLPQLLGDVDFDSVLDGHGQRFEHYLDFLHRNGLSTVFDGPQDEGRELPFDAAVAKVQQCGPVTMKGTFTAADRLRLRFAALN